MGARIRRKTGILLVLMATPLAAASAEDYELRIAIDDGTPDGQLFIELDDATNGLDLDSLQVGESRSLIDKSGRAVLMTRTVDGFELNVNGRIIELPALGGEATHDVHIAGAGDAAVEIERHVRVVDKTAGPNDAVTVISRSPIDKATRDVIRDALAAAGHDARVEFIDTSALPEVTGASRHGERHIRIVSEEINATQ